MSSAEPHGLFEGTVPPRPAEPELPRLTKAEDAEMRQLSWFAQIGPLSPKSQERLAALRARDRRESVRDVRPDPMSGQSSGPALLRSVPAPESKHCRNCGFEGSGLNVSPYCPGCGQRFGPSPFDKPPSS